MSDAFLRSRHRRSVREERKRLRPCGGDGDVIMKAPGPAETSENTPQQLGSGNSLDWEGGRYCLEATKTGVRRTDPAKSCEPEPASRAKDT
jgi:hypothetical protein